MSKSLVIPKAAEITKDYYGSPCLEFSWWSHTSATFVFPLFWAAGGEDEEVISWSQI